MTTSNEYDVLERKTLVPDPGLVKSLGMHHTLESAVADLVDNSIDAGASRVAITFETADGAPAGLTVIDNGRGMTGGQVDEAMRLGQQRDYENDAQGHYGVGLKAASFSHADTLTVLTTTDLADVHGRRLHRSDMQRDYGCDVLVPGAIRKELEGCLARFDARSGTVVRWSDTRFPRTTALGNSDWLEDSKTRLRMHLGVIYHRLLAANRVRIQIGVFDRDLNAYGAPEQVAPIDPLGFAASAVTGYPRDLVAVVGEVPVRLGCHIVPPKSSGPSFRLYGRDGADFQGFFIYRNDRLLQVGGWNEVTTAHRHRGLARVVIDDFSSIAGLVRMNPEKSGIILSHELQHALAAATAPEDAGSAVSFKDYLERAEAVFIESRQRRRVRKPVAEPSKGLHDEIRRAIRAEIPIRQDEDPVEMRWRRMPAEKFFEIDREARTVYLNQQYRQMLTGGKTGLSDAPLIKTLMFLLVEELFKGQHWGPRDKDFAEMWDSVLGTAVQLEYAYREGGRG
ncbi:ATP-binding protein [Actinoplanes sp. NPDC023714]|uniref:ATP-binding protein n=1 Tax=Actinoplanes sp. NPDC023714 TaxID=3154322 RepID=UPI0033CCCE70